MSDQLLETFRNIGKITLGLRNSISEAMKPIVDFGIKMNEYFNSEEMQKTFNNIIEGIEQTEEDVTNYKKAMLLLGYPPNISTDIFLMREIGREFIDNKTAYLEHTIDDIIKNYYNPAKMAEIKNQWENYEFLNERICLLRQAINAHNLGMFAISIPSILSQMEGVIIEGYKIKQKVEGYKFKQIIIELFKNEEGFSFNFDNEVRDFYLNFILVGFTHGMEIKSEVSRHAILHGGAKPNIFNKEEVSLKIILMMDNILYRVNELTEEEIIETKESLGLK